MANVIPIAGVAAGAIGSPYLTLITSPNISTENNILVSSNRFPAIAPYVPGWFLVVGTPVANLTLSVSTDNGSTWAKQTNWNGGWIFVDSGKTLSFNIGTSAATINFFPMSAV